jgi:hypothetical protein
VCHIAAEYAITRVPVKEESLKLNSINWFLVYAEDVHILDGSVHAVKKSTEALEVGSK